MSDFDGISGSDRINDSDGTSGAMSDESTTRRGGLIEFFATNSVAANLVMAVMLIGGFFAGTGLISEVFPTIEPGLIRINVPYPGATPSEVDEAITRRVDQAVSGLDGVDRVVAEAFENRGSVSIEIKDFADGEKLKDDVQSAVDRISSFPPLDAEEPEVTKLAARSNVMTLVVASDLSELDLREAAADLEEALLALANVSLVDIQGLRDYEISIEVSEDALRQYSLTLSQIANIVRLSSINLSSGELRTQAGDLLLRTNRKRETGEQFADIALRALPDGSVLKLGDIATIRDSFIDVDLINEYNGRPAIFVVIQRSTSEDSLQIEREIQDLLATYDAGEGIDVAIWSNEVDILQARISLLVRNGILGFVLVFLFLLIMLDMKLAIWVAMGVPISFLGAFLFFGYFDVSINMVSLFALIVVLGIVVDDAIVVGENIGTEQERGLRGPLASIAGVRGVAGPVSVGVTTTMAAFAPLMFVTGTFGQILGTLPVVVILVLLMSLVEVFLILPAHLSHHSKWSRWPLDVIQQRVAKATQYVRDQWLLPTLSLIIRSHRWKALVCALLFLLIPVALVMSNAVRFEFFPSIESDSIAASMEFPVGTAFSTTLAGAEQLEQAARSIANDVEGEPFEAISVTVGGQLQSGGGPGGQTGVRIGSHLVSVRVALHEEPLRQQSAVELARRWRLATGDVAGVDRLNFQSNLFGDNTRIEYELIHPDHDTMVAAIDRIVPLVRNVPGVADVETTLNLGKRQFDIELTSAGEAAGLTESDIARQLRQSFFGEEVHRLQRGREELKVMVRYPREERRSTTDLINTRIRLADGTESPLSTVANLKESRSFSSIRRVDGASVTTVSAGVDTVLKTTQQVSAALDSDVLPIMQAEFPDLRIRSAGFAREQTEDLIELGSAMGVALLLIFVLLASYLKSYLKTIVILTAIPFGAAGAIVGHWLLGYDLSFPSIFGMIALSGVVVNDSLVLLHRYGKFHRESPDSSVIDTCLAAVKSRFRAVILTTMTTALGLTPMLFETSIQAQFLIPMAVSLATGILFASFVILFLVPLLLVIVERGRTHQTLEEELDSAVGAALTSTLIGTSQLRP